MSFKILLVINVQGAVFELAHCLTRRTCSEREAARLAVETLLCVWLPWFSSVCFVPFFLPLFFPPLFPPPQFPPLLPLLQATLDVVMNLQFHYIEKLWQTFWYSTPPPSDGSTTLPSRSERKRGKKASVFDARALNDPVMSCL